MKSKNTQFNCLQDFPETALSILPSVSLDRLQNLPECSAIYFVFNIFNHVFYVGKAINLKKRWQGHHRYQQLAKIHKKTLIKIAWIECDSNLLAELESFYIDYFAPVLNNTIVYKGKTIPSETILQISLQKIAKYSIIFGVRSPQENSLPTVVIRYFNSGFSGDGKEARLIGKTLKALSKKSSPLKWVHFFRLQDVGGWRCKCNGYQIEVAQIHTLEPSVTRRALNDRMANILLDLNYGQRLITTKEQLEVVKKIDIPLAEIGSLLKTHPNGLKEFPLQSEAQVKQVAGVEMLALTASQLAMIQEKSQSYQDLQVIENDPIKLYFSL